LKIVDVSVSLLDIPVERPLEAGGRTVTGHWHVLAELTTADGVRGFGYDVFRQKELVGPVVAAGRELGDRLVGMNVLEPEAAWEKLQHAGRWIGPGGLLHYAIAPLDIALWDAAGKTLGQPLYRLLGGYRDRVEVYATDGFTYDLSVEQLTLNARARVAEGFSALKMRALGGRAGPDDVLRRVSAVREAVGHDVRILLEGAQSWDVSQALSVGRALQDAGIHWIEDPVHHKDFAGLAKIAGRLDAPIATGENLYELSDYARLFEAGGAGIAIVDLGRIGGFTPWRRVAALANAYSLRVCGHVLPELHVHPLAAIPNGYLAEYGPRSAPILESMPVLQDGKLVAPSGPGLGISLDADAVRRYKVAS
jgi:L-alanine-DL-glutamate epimerase-like enolase superfamily enzyme